MLRNGEGHRSRKNYTETSRIVTHLFRLRGGKRDLTETLKGPDHLEPLLLSLCQSSKTYKGEKEPEDNRLCTCSCSS